MMFELFCLFAREETIMLVETIPTGSQTTSARNMIFAYKNTRGNVGHVYNAH